MKIINNQFLSLCLCASLLVSAGTAYAKPGASHVENGEIVSGQSGQEGDVILCVSDEPFTAAGKAGELLRGAEELMDTDEGRLLQVVSSEYTNEDLISLFEGVPEVLWAEPNLSSGIVEPDTEQAASGEAGSPDDILLPVSADVTEKCNLTDKQYAYGNGPGGMDVPGWNDPANENANGTVVAVVDTGVDYTHPDLAPVMWDEGLDYPELVAMGGGKYGINTGGEGTTDDPMPNDHPGGDHGTHCAGIIAAAWNDFGVSGEANGAKIMAVRHSDDHQIETHATTLKAFRYIAEAKKQGVNVVAVSCSFGESGHSQALTLGIEELAKLGIVTVMASGNQDWDNDINSFSVSTSTHASSLISVDNCREDGSKNADSSYGVRTTDLFAPGSLIWSTINTAHPDYQEIQTPGTDAAGRKMHDDFSSENTYFHYEYGEDTPGRIESHPSEEYRYSLTESWDDKDGEAGYHFAYVTLPEGAGKLSDTAFVNLSIKLENCDPAEDSFVLVAAKNSDGGYSYAENDPSLKYYGYYDPDEGGWQLFNLALPKDMIREDPVIRLSIFGKPDETGTMKVHLGDLRIVSDPDLSAYGVKTGTSMATPAVAGEVAIMAARWPEDSAEKRAARVLAGVKETEQLKGLCRMGGVANVRNSLDESRYRPVVNDVRPMANGKLHIRGFFFGEGNKDVTISQGDGTWDINAVKGTSSADGEETLVCDIPEGLTEGEIIVTVTDPVSHRSGSRVVRTGPLGDKYRRITLPSSDRFRSGWFHSSHTDGDRVWLLSKNDDNDAYETWIFDTGSLEFTFLSGDEAVPAGLYGNVADYQGHLLFFDEEGEGKPARVTEDVAELSELAWYDPDRLSVINRVTVRTSDGDKLPDGVRTLIADKDCLLCFNTPYSLSGSYPYYKSFKPSSLFRIDPVTGSAEKLLDLSASILPETALKLDGDGTIRALGCRFSDEAKAWGAGAEYYRITLRKQNDGYVEEKTQLSVPAGTGLQMEIPSGFGGTDGIYMAGPATTLSESAAVTADNYYCPWDGTAFSKGAGRISDSRTFNSLTFAAGDNIYFFGETADSENGYVLTCSRLPEPVPQKAEPADDSILRKDLSALTVGQQKYILSRSPYETGKEKVSFQSSDPKAVSVRKGLVTAKKATDTPVSITVTVKRDNSIVRTEVMKLTVADDNKPGNVKKDKGASLFSSKSSIKIAAGETLSLTIGAKGSDYKNENRVLRAYTSRAKLVSLTESSALTDDGKKSLSKTLTVKGLAPGTSWIAIETFDRNLYTEKEEMNRKLIKVTVTAPAKSIGITGDSKGLLSDGSLILREGDSDVLRSLLNPLDCTEVSKLKWKVSGKGVTVKNGVVTAKKASAVKNGALVPATVTVSCGAQKAEVRVFVTAK